MKVIIIKNAAEKFSPRVICLPEMFNTPYTKEYFKRFAEEIGGPVHEKPTIEFLKEIAVETKTYIVGGSIPELDNDKVYNTSLVFNPEGELICKYRKMHLFDIDIPGQKYMVELYLNFRNLKRYLQVMNSDCLMLKELLLDWESAMIYASLFKLY